MLIWSKYIKNLSLKFKCAKFLEENIVEKFPDVGLDNILEVTAN